MAQTHRLIRATFIKADRVESVVLIGCNGDGETDDFKVEQLWARQYSGWRLMRGGVSVARKAKKKRIGYAIVVDAMSDSEF